MKLKRIAVFTLLIGAAWAVATAHAQQTPYGNIGREPTAEEIAAWDIAISPTGQELPPGHGTAAEGAVIFASKCAACHGPNGEGTKLAPRVIGGELKVNEGLHIGQPELHPGSAWPFATIFWDYINRAMPWGQGGSLKPDQVYSLTAFLLFKNDIIDEADVMDARSLPRVVMPNRNGYVPPPVAKWKPGMRRLFAVEPSR